MLNATPKHYSGSDYVREHPELYHTCCITFDVAVLMAPDVPFLQGMGLLGERKGVPYL